VPARLAPAPHRRVRRLSHAQVAADLLLPLKVGDVVAWEDAEPAPAQQRAQADLRRGEQTVLLQQWRVLAVQRGCWRHRRAVERSKVFKTSSHL